MKSKIKRAIQYLEIARKSDHVTFHTMLGGKEFKEEMDETIKSLKEVAEWSKEDDKKLSSLIEELKKEMEGKNIQEKTDKLKKIFKVGGGIAVGIGVISALGIGAYIHKKERGKEDKK